MGIRRINGQDGFTLAEVLVATSILAVMGLLMLSFLTQGLNLWQVITVKSDLRSYARNAMNYMTQELRSATSTAGVKPPKKNSNPPNLSIPSKPNNKSIDFYLPADIDGNSLIIDNAGEVEWEKSNKIQYQYIPGLKQLRRLEKGNKYIIANNVISIVFEDNTIDPFLYDNELRIILTVEGVTPQKRTMSVTLTSIVKLRNQ